MKPHHIWHDHFCNCFDQRQAGRPLEFHCLDQFSACKIAWGMRLRTRTEEGREKGLTAADMRFLLAYVLGEIGYSPRGTILVVEKGTAAIDRHLAKFLFDATDGLITVKANGLGGDTAHGGQHRGAAKGNPRHKAAIESLGNLIHNEFGSLPAQTGKDRVHRPEGLGTLLKANERLLAAHATLPPERAARLEWEVMPFRDFQLLAGDVYERINRRDEHALEGWDEQMVYCPIQGRVRRRTPREVFDAGRGELIRLAPALVAAILGPDAGKTLTVRSGYLKVMDKTLSPDPLRFDPAALGLREGAEVANVVIAFRNALVKYGSDDRHFTAIASAADVPCGVLLNDQVDPGESDLGGMPTYIKKEVALFGLYHESLPGVATAAIAAFAYVVADPANPGQVIQLPAAAGTYIIIGRARFAVVNPGDPVSIIHCLPFALTH